MKLASYLDPTSRHSLNRRFRLARFAFFARQLERARFPKPVRILDIGGTEAYWQNVNFVDNGDVAITLLNREKVEVTNRAFTSVAGDACDLGGYRDGAFDVVHSNSVIEHLFTRDNQQRMADEARRVGRAYYIQTPNRSFPIEPHWLVPFWQFLPFNSRVFLTRHLNLGHYPRAADRDAAVERVREVRLLTEDEMQTMFPDGEIYRERFLGLTKSITMYRFPRS